MSAIKDDYWMEKYFKSIEARMTSYEKDSKDWRDQADQRLRKIEDAILSIKSKIIAVASIISFVTMILFKGLSIIHWRLN